MSVFPRCLASAILCVSGLVLAPTGGAWASPPAVAAAQSKTVEPKEPPAEDETEAAAKEPTELERMREEKDRLATEYALLQQRQKNELLELELAKARLQAEASLAQTRLAAELAEMKAEIERLKTEASLRSTRQAEAFAEAQATIERLQSERRLADAMRDADLEEATAEAKRLMAENNLVQQQIKQAQLQVSLVQAKHQAEAAEIQSLLAAREVRDKAKDVVLADERYRESPFRDGTLFISDRRIPLNGPIWSGTANYVTERIDFFNNQSKDDPIFIVIDDCPGGSVMEGYRIVKAVEASPAPVHVVVKSFAASMAAVITTLAEHSYAYPNAIILHHQMSSGMSGNLTQQAEQLENSREWERRLAEPVARKMGVSLERFRKMMYENNSDGDWVEFADKARRLKWVNEIVNDIREEGIRARPKENAPSPLPFFFQAKEDVDEKGQAFVKLPRLSPFDHWFLYNPDGYYR